MRLGEGAANRRIEVLDGLRALAIMAVLAFHYTVRWAPPFDEVAHFPPGAVFADVAALKYGYMGVELFFVVSGFVILMTLERCESILDFARRRAARLWPPLVVAAIVSTIVVNALGPVDWRVGIVDFAESLTLIEPALFKYIHPALSGHWVDGVYWSLAVEIKFYVVAAALYFTSKQNFFRNFLALEVGLIVVQTALYLLDAAPGLTKLLNVLLFTQYAPYFLLGACVYGLYKKGAEARMALIGAAFSSTIIGVWSVATVGIFAGQSAWICFAVNVAIIALFALFLADSPVMRPFAAKPVVALGRASYSLYLLHQVVGITLMLEAVNRGVPYLLALPAVTGLMIVLALLMFRHVEEPGKNWVLRLTGRNARKARAPST